MNVSEKPSCRLCSSHRLTTQNCITAAECGGRIGERTLRRKFGRAANKVDSGLMRCSMAGNRSKTSLIVQERDRRLLAEIATMRIIDRELAKVAVGFRSTTRANTRLLKLTRAGLLNRFFIGSVAAGRKAIYTLSKR